MSDIEKPRKPFRTIAARKDNHWVACGNNPKVAITFPPSLFDEIRAEAIKRKIPFGAEVRRRLERASAI